MKRFYYKFRQEPYAYGPTEWFKNEREARVAIRKQWNLNTLRGVEIWEA